MRDNQNTEAPKPPNRRRNIRPDDPAFARLTVATVALEFGHPDLSIDLRLKGTKQLVYARQVAMYLLQTVFDMTTTRTAELFSRDRSTVSHALKVVEESREDPVLNRKLIKVEDFLFASFAEFGDLVDGEAA